MRASWITADAILRAASREARSPSRRWRDRFRWKRRYGLTTVCDDASLDSRVTGDPQGRGMMMHPEITVMNDRERRKQMLAAADRSRRARLALLSRGDALTGSN